MMKSAEADVAKQLKISPAGAGGLLLDASRTDFSLPTQQKPWATEKLPSKRPLAGMREAVVGVNSLLLVFDPLLIAPSKVEAELTRMWDNSPLPQSAPALIYILRAQWE